MLAMIKNRLSKVGIPVDSLFFCGCYLFFDGGFDLVQTIAVYS
jgi:hypothetical protein